MGQACARGENKGDEVDQMQPRINHAHNGSQITNTSEQTNGGGGVMTSSTNSFQSSFDGKGVGELFYDGRAASAQEKLSIEDF